MLSVAVRLRLLHKAALHAARLVANVAQVVVFIFYFLRLHLNVSLYLSLGLLYTTIDHREVRHGFKLDLHLQQG